MSVSCYICNNTYDINTIVTHVLDCLDEWDEKQKKLPLSQRLPPPLPPMNMERMLAGKLKGKELDEFNTAALKEWNRVTLAACKYCKR